MTIELNNARRRQSGFSLIEVLVSVVVFSIGMLGVAGLNAFSKRATFESVQRAQASELGYALLEMLRANKAGLQTYLAAGTLGRGSRGSEPAPHCDTVGATCTATQLATHDLWAWERMLDTGLESAGGNSTGGLVQASACITGPPPATAGDVTVVVVWRGVTDLTDSGLSPCGAGIGLYGPGDDMRRMVINQSYIDPNS